MLYMSSGHETSYFIKSSAESRLPSRKVNNAVQCHCMKQETPCSEAMQPNNHELFVVGNNMHWRGKDGETIAAVGNIKVRKR